MMWDTLRDAFSKALQKSDACAFGMCTHLDWVHICDCPCPHSGMVEGLHFACEMQSVHLTGCRHNQHVCIIECVQS